jgi:hypothetical protein
MRDTTVLPTWLGYSTLGWIVTGFVVGGILLAMLALVRGRHLFATTLAFTVAIGVAGTGIWYRQWMTESRRTCDTTLFSAHVRTPGCPID